MRITIFSLIPHVNRIKCKTPLSSNISFNTSLAPFNILQCNQIKVSVLSIANTKPNTKNYSNTYFPSCIYGRSSQIPNMQVDCKCGFILN